MRSALFVALCSVMITSAGCAGSPPVPPTSAPTGAQGDNGAMKAASQEAPASAGKPIGEAKVGDKTRCPVMNHEFVVTESSPKLEHEGKTYYFCCPGCIEQFKANPNKYLSKPQT